MCLFVVRRRAEEVALEAIDGRRHTTHKGHNAWGYQAIPPGGRRADAVNDEQSDRALLVLDMTPSRVADVPGAQELVRYIRGELRYFRERGRPVIFAVGTGEPAELIPELTPRTGEPILQKGTPSAFFGTDLDEHLPDSIRRLTLVGLDTATSILLTAGDAYARGYQVVVPEPCAASSDPADHEAAMHLIRDVWKPHGVDRGPLIPLSQEGRAVSDEGEPA
jgi:nicotinamidase-related amidase